MSSCDDVAAAVDATLATQALQLWAWPSWCASSFGSDVADVLPPVLQCLRSFDRVIETCSEVLHMHHDDDAVVQGLRTLQELAAFPVDAVGSRGGDAVRASPLMLVSSASDCASVFAAFCVFHSALGMRIVSSALQNIEVTVMAAATDTLAYLLAAYPPGVSVALSVPRHVPHRVSSRCGRA